MRQINLQMPDNCTVKQCGNTNFSQANGSHGSLQEGKMPHAEIFKLSIEVLIGWFGVTGNILVAIVISRLGRRRRPVDCYVHNLAIADLGTLLLTFPFFAIRVYAPLD